MGDCRAVVAMKFSWFHSGANVRLCGIVKMVNVVVSLLFFRVFDVWLNSFNF